MSEIIAEREVFVATPAGEKSVIRLVVGKPYLKENMWACPVVMEGLYKKPLDIYGGDSWQALHLGISFCHTTLNHLIEEGKKLYWDESEKELIENAWILVGITASSIEEKLASQVNRST